MRWDYMRWDEMRWDEMRWDEMRWDDMIWDDMRWDEMRWDDSGSMLCWTRSSGVGFRTPHTTKPTWEIYVGFLYFRHNNIQILNFNFKILASDFLLFVECLIVHGRRDRIRAIGSDSISWMWWWRSEERRILSKAGQEEVLQALVSFFFV